MDEGHVMGASCETNRALMLASIVAGLALGMLALKSRSIWPGVIIHCTVAFCMDWFALVRSGRMAALW